jgi:cobalt-zinc-cadmium efflux system membrane fusion protein
MIDTIFRGKPLWLVAAYLLVLPMLVFSAASVAVELHENQHGNEAEPEKGPHNGRLLTSGKLAVELAIFEAGVAPEFRAWVTENGQPIEPETVSLGVTLTRLGNLEDKIQFQPQADFLRGDTEVYEPHSFVVTISADYQGKNHHWQYDNFEGRTHIEPEIAAAMKINTEVAGEATLIETIEAFGKVIPKQGAQRDISARFDGQIKEVYVGLGQVVEKGDKLLSIESNESLKSYTIVSPINGVVLTRAANASEQTQGRLLLSIVDPSRLSVELSIFGPDQRRVSVGAGVQLISADQSQPILGKIVSIIPKLGTSQALTLRVDFDDSNGDLVLGQFVTARIDVAEYLAPLAVKRKGLQSFRDFTVVYAKVGAEYEVRMLELGRQAGEWAEVLGGLQPGTEYVTENSFIIKADIEKSGAAHDH